MDPPVEPEDDLEAQLALLQTVAEELENAAIGENPNPLNEF